MHDREPCTEFLHENLSLASITAICDLNNGNAIGPHRLCESLLLREREATRHKPIEILAGLRAADKRNRIIHLDPLLTVTTRPIHKGTQGSRCATLQGPSRQHLTSFPKTHAWRRIIVRLSYSNSGVEEYANTSFWSSTGQ